MAFIHGKATFVSLGGVDLSAFTNSTELAREANSHDVTTYGQNAHIYQGGLTDGKGTIGGIYDDTVTGPRDVIAAIVGTVVPFVFRPEGTGTGRPQDTVQVLVLNYAETNPVADMVTWTSELQLSGTIVTINQA